MAYDRELADRLRFLLGGEGTVEQRMFGGLAFLASGAMAVAASRQGGLLVRVDPAATRTLLTEPGVEEFRMGARGPVRGWLHVSADVLDDDDALRAWADRGLAAARAAAG